MSGGSGTTYRRLWAGQCSHSCRAGVALLLGVAVISFSSTGARAQERAGQQATSDSLTTAGRIAGDSAARQLAAPGYFFGGFLGGMVGAIGLVAVAAGGGETALLPTGIGVAFVVSAIGNARDRGKLVLPDREERRIQMRLPEYRAAFRSAWAEQLRHKRQLTTIIGAVSGAGAGVLIASVLANLYN